MTHAGWDNRLSPYLDGELPPDERRAVERHLADCPRCLSRVEELRRVSESIRGLERIPMPDDLKGAIARAARGAAGSSVPSADRPRAGALRRPWAIASAAAGALVVVVALVISPQVVRRDDAAQVIEPPRVEMERRVEAVRPAPPQPPAAEPKVVADAAPTVPRERRLAVPPRRMTPTPAAEAPAPESAPASPLLASPLLPRPLLPGPLVPRPPPSSRPRRRLPASPGGRSRRPEACRGQAARPATSRDSSSPGKRIRRWLRSCPPRRPPCLGRRRLEASKR